MTLIQHLRFGAVHAQYPKSYEAAAGYKVSVTPLGTVLTQRAALTLYVLLGTAASMNRWQRFASTNARWTGEACLAVTTTALVPGPRMFSWLVVAK